MYDTERERNPDPIDISIHTRVPSKWRWVDLETGDVWKYEDGRFTRATDLGLDIPRILRS